MICNIDPKYTQYAEDVLSGKIIAGELIHLCCERYLSWFERDDIYFDPVRASKPVNFIKHLRHFEGEYAGKPFILQDWQEFLVYGICGWIRKDNNTRLIRNAYVQISRKCGKTALAAALGLYFLIADDEAGAEVACVSPSAEQSRIAFKKASTFADSINKFNSFKALRGEIRYDKTKSRFRIMSSDAKFGDGFSNNMCIIDEYHAFVNNDIPNVIISGMGYRKQPLMLMITTAGFSLFGPCKTYRDMCEEILRGLKTDDTIFPLIYELDEDDDIEDISVWKKCCPSLGLTVNADYMRQQLTMMKNNPADEVAILTKTFNKWVPTSLETWIPLSYIQKATQVIDLDQFKDKKINCVLGLDLASVSDFTSLSMVFLYEGKLWFKTWIFLPEIALEENKNKYLYQQWKRNNQIIITPGNATDYEYVLKKILEINESIPIYKVIYDTYNATQFTIYAQQNGVKMEPISQAVGAFNGPTKEFERQLYLGKIVIDDNEAVRWCFNNATLRYGPNDNYKPEKKAKSEKIDAVISMIQALAGCNSIYEYKHFFTVV